MDAPSRGSCTPKIPRTLANGELTMYTVRWCQGGACRFLLDPVAKRLVADAELFSHLGDGGTFGSGHGH